MEKQEEECKNQQQNKDYSKELIEDILNELYESKINTGRKFKLLTGCSTNGWTDLELENLCNNPDCVSCRNFEKILKKEINKWNANN